MRPAPATMSTPPPPPTLSGKKPPGPPTEPAVSVTPPPKKPSAIARLKAALSRVFGGKKKTAPNKTHTHTHTHTHKPSHTHGTTPPATRPSQAILTHSNTHHTKHGYQHHHSGGPHSPEPTYVTNPHNSRPYGSARLSDERRTSSKGKSRRSSDLSPLPNVGGATGRCSCRKSGAATPTCTTSSGSTAPCRTCRRPARQSYVNPSYAKPSYVKPSSGRCGKCGKCCCNGRSRPATPKPARRKHQSTQTAGQRECKTQRVCKCHCERRRVC